jgi:hypothetical protein
MPAITRLTALGLYKALTHELDKTNTPSFTITQFNYYANKEQLKLAADLYDLFERTQKLSDDLSIMVKRQPYTTTTTPPLLPGQQMTMPTDYDHLLQANCTYLVNNAFGAYRKNETLFRKAQRITADQQEYVEHPNHYLRATYDRVYRRVAGGQVEILSGIHSRLTLQSVNLEYLCRPDEIILYEADVADLTTDNSQQLSWPPSVTYTLVTYMVKAFMEQMGNQRLGTYAQLNQPNVGAPPPAPAPAQAQQRAVAADPAAQSAN